MTTQTMDIVTFAREVLKKQLFDYEIPIIENYREIMADIQNFQKWVRPERIENNYLLEIYMLWCDHVGVERPTYEHFKRWELV